MTKESSFCQIEEFQGLERFVTLRISPGHRCVLHFLSHLLIFGTTGHRMKQSELTPSGEHYALATSASFKGSSRVSIAISETILSFLVYKALCQRLQNHPKMHQVLLLDDTLRLIFGHLIPEMTRLPHQCTETTATRLPSTHSHKLAKHFPTLHWISYGVNFDSLPPS